MDRRWKYHIKELVISYDDSLLSVGFKRLLIKLEFRFRGCGSERC